jgi:hypothetical protein
MSDFIPKAGGIKVSGLGPKAQKLQAMREKAEKMKSGAKLGGDDSSAAVKAKSSFSGKKVSFQRKAV